MKREEKNALSKQRILEAALHEFSENGYENASLNTICSANELSKGIIYHYFKDKEELYLLCVEMCFQNLTQYLQEVKQSLRGTIEQQLEHYFDARLHFFVEQPLLLGIFFDVALNPPAALMSAIQQLRLPFDEMNKEVLSSLLKQATLRINAPIATIIDDFRMYMDYFNMRFKDTIEQTTSLPQALQAHEEQCHRQLRMLLFGIMKEEQHESN